MWESPRSASRALLIGPLQVAAAVILFVILNAPTWLLLLGIVLLIVQCVQTAVYLPRARRAIAEEQENLEILAGLNDDRSKRLGS